MTLATDMYVIFGKKQKHPHTQRHGERNNNLDRVYCYLLSSATQILYHASNILSRLFKGISKVLLTKTTICDIICSFLYKVLSVVVHGNRFSIENAGELSYHSVRGLPFLCFSYFMHSHVPHIQNAIYY